MAVRPCARPFDYSLDRANSRTKYDVFEALLMQWRRDRTDLAILMRGRAARGRSTVLSTERMSDSTPPLLTARAMCG